MKSAYELAGRRAKVLHMLAAVPLAVNAAEIAAMADRFAAFTQAERDAWALGAGCKRGPSEETWSEFLNAVRARATVTPDKVRESQTRMRAVGRTES